MPGLMRAMVRTTAVVGTAAAVSGGVAHRQQGRWAAQEQAAAPPAEAPVEAAPVEAAPPPPAASMDDKIAQLKELGELKTSGVLTEAEFEVQKDKILHP